MRQNGGFSRAISRRYGATCRRQIQVGIVPTIICGSPCRVLLSRYCHQGSAARPQLRLLRNLAELPGGAWRLDRRPRSLIGALPLGLGASRHNRRCAKAPPEPMSVMLTHWRIADGPTIFCCNGGRPATFTEYRIRSYNDDHGQKSQARSSSRIEYRETAGTMGVRRRADDRCAGVIPPDALRGGKG